MKNFSAKTVLRVLMAFTGIFAITQVALSSGDVQLTPLNESSKAVLTLPQSQMGKTRISIQDQSENYVFYDKAFEKSSEKRKLLDLTNLADGSYCLIIEANSETVRKEFDIVNNALEIKSKTEAFPPHVIKGDDYLALFFNGEGLGNVKVRFLQEGETIFSDESGKELLKKKYDLTKLPEGEYEVVVSAGDYFYSYNLDL